jgi:hypothetical protein
MQILVKSEGFLRQSARTSSERIYAPNFLKSFAISLSGFGVLPGFTGEHLGRIAAPGESSFQIRDISGIKLAQLNYSALPGVTVLVTVRFYKVTEESVFRSFIVGNNADIHKTSLLYLTTLYNI